jgi:hypothetical protein
MRVAPCPAHNSLDLTYLAGFVAVERGASFVRDCDAALKLYDVVSVFWVQGFRSNASK